MSLTTSAVPSGESSSTKIASHEHPANVGESFSTKTLTLSFSLYVGITIVICTLKINLLYSGSFIILPSGHIIKIYLCTVALKFHNYFSAQTKSTQNNILKVL